jgi:hypothetical protein
VSARRGLRQRQESVAELSRQVRDAREAMEETQERCQREIRGYDQVTCLWLSYGLSDYVLQSIAAAAKQACVHLSYN